jgi:hypothetical protein
MCYSPATHHSDGTKGTCGQSGDLLVHDREEFCSCGMFMELPKKEKLVRTIVRDLHAWIRERDAMFVRSMELVCHIGHLFEQGEFKVFDVVKSASEMKGLVFFGKETLTGLDRVWTYHCPWNDDMEFFIVITQSGKLVVNSWMNDKFVFEWFDIEEDFGWIFDLLSLDNIVGGDGAVEERRNNILDLTNVEFNYKEILDLIDGYSDKGPSIQDVVDDTIGEMIN